MGPDKLECLLDSFIRSRSRADTVDGVPADILNFPDESCFNKKYEAQGAGGLSSQFPPAIQSSQVVRLGKYLADLADEFSTHQQNNSCVRFEKLCVIVPPEEQTISITLIRSDTFKDTITKVSWKTLDKTAVSGTHYIASSGEILFNKGVIKKTVQIKILKTSDVAMDLRFNVQMSVLDEGLSPKLMTVTLKKINDFSEDERQVVESLPCSAKFTVEGIRSILEASLNCRTFHMALTHLCSAADSVHLEFALAFDLSQLCLSKLRRSSVLKVLEDFFRMEDIEM